MAVSGTVTSYNPHKAIAGVHPGNWGENGDILGSKMEASLGHLTTSHEVEFPDFPCRLADEGSSWLRPKRERKNAIAPPMAIWEDGWLLFLPHDKSLGLALLIQQSTVDFRIWRRRDGALSNAMAKAFSSTGCESGNDLNRRQTRRKDGIARWWFSITLENGYVNIYAYTVIYIFNISSAMLLPPHHWNFHKDQWRVGHPAGPTSLPSWFVIWELCSKTSGFSGVFNSPDCWLFCKFHIPPKFTAGIWPHSGPITWWGILTHIILEILNWRTPYHHWFPLSRMTNNLDKICKKWYLVILDTPILTTFPRYLCQAAVRRLLPRQGHEGLLHRDAGRQGEVTAMKLGASPAISTTTHHRAIGHDWISSKQPGGVAVQI